MQKAHVFHLNQLPSKSQIPSDSVLLYDSILQKKPFFRAWKKGFKYQLALKAGEDLKSLDSFTSVLKKLSALNLPQTTELTFVAVGGGSVGDFAGFLSSVFLRGRSLILIPSTWLSAVDSAHGGKNGINLLKQKNQVGTFHQPQKIFIVKQLLVEQPRARLTEALGEVIKIAIINNSRAFSKLEKADQKIDEKFIFKILPSLIESKYKIIKKDPFEIKGDRRVLNLGHTMGHVFESYYGWPHGVCVLLGTFFAARWSYQLKYLNQKDYLRIIHLIETIFQSINLSQDLAGLDEKFIENSLGKDKKRVSKKEVDFIFIKSIGKVVRKKVTFKKIQQEIRRQKRES